MILYVVAILEERMYFMQFNIQNVTEYMYVHFES